MPIAEDDVISYLDSLPPRVSPRMFNALFRRWVTTAFELVVLVPSEDGLRVALSVRPDDDTERPGMLHVPGTVMMRGDTESSALDRLLNGDMEGAELSRPVFVDFMPVPMGNGPDECARGQVTELIYLSLLTGGTFNKPTVLAGVDDLPLQKFGWPYHRHLIARAIKFYCVRK